MPYNLAILGRGSSAAYYLNTVDRNMFPNIVVIGEDDPWAGKRGGDANHPQDAANFINQTPQMIGHYGASVPKFGKELVPRSEWAAANKRVIDECNVKQVRGTIVKVKRVQTPKQYLTAFGNASHVISITAKVNEHHFNIQYYAAKVIVATGAGPHKTPNQRLGELAVQHPGLFMDMDQFARIPVSQRANKRVIVQGPNAAVDTADTAQLTGCTVYWLVGRTQPAILETPHQVGARAVIANKSGVGSRTITIDQARDPVNIAVIGNEIKVTLSSGPPLTADYYVWGIGQDEKVALSFIDSSLLAEMEPIYDINQRHGAAYESVHGFQVKGTTMKEGFQVIGALARQVLIANNKLKHNYLQQLENAIEELQGKIARYTHNLVYKYGYDRLLQPVKCIVNPVENVTMDQVIQNLERMREDMDKIIPSWINQTKALTAMIINYATAKKYFDKHGDLVKDDDLNNALKTLTRSTVGSPQLGSIRTVTSAMNGFIPKYVARDVNMSQDDRSILRVFIARNYPLVSESDAARIIGKMIAGRPKTTDAWGYTDLQVQTFRLELAMLNNRGIVALCMPKLIGTGQTM